MGLTNIGGIICWTRKERVIACLHLRARLIVCAVYFTQNTPWDYNTCIVHFFYLSLTCRRSILWNFRQMSHHSTLQYLYLISLTAPFSNTLFMFLGMIPRLVSSSWAMEGRRTIRQNGEEGRRWGEGCSNSNKLELPTCNCERSKTGFIFACVQL